VPGRVEQITYLMDPLYPEDILSSVSYRGRPMSLINFR
jgi:hypothetical protein